LKGNPADYIVIISYLIGVAAFGILTGGKQKSVKNYFLGSKTVPWKINLKNQL